VRSEGRVGREKFLAFLVSLCTSTRNKGEIVQGEGEKRRLFPSTMEKEEGMAAHRKKPH